MTTAGSTLTADALVAAFEQVEALPGVVAETDLWALSENELRDLIPRLTRLTAGLASAQARLLAEADRREVGTSEGHHDTAGWLASGVQMTRPAAKGLVAFARHLDTPTHQCVRRALDAGRILREQADVIITAINRLDPATSTDDIHDLGITPAQVEAAEQHLVDLAAIHDARELRILGNRIVEVIAPELVDEYERRLLEAEEARANAGATFSIRPDGAGMMRGTFRIPELTGAILKKHLDALAAPKHQAASGNQSPAAPRVARPLRMGEAFQEYITTRPVGAGGTPHAGGIPATIVVTMTHQALTGALESAAILDTGEHISASAARMLACQAGIIPAVLGTKSQVLDLGRKTRFHTEPQRIAIGLRDQGCRAEHCDWPPGMCHVHHQTPWSHGGSTNIDDAVMLCPRHHTLAHNPNYQTITTPHGKLKFTRRTSAER